MRTAENIKTAIFDLDGTLFDSAELWDAIDIEFLRRRGLSPTPEYKSGITALGNLEVARFTIKYYGLKDTVEELTAEWGEMARYEYSHNIGLIDGAKEFLTSCVDAGIRLAALTSLARELAEPCLKNNGIDGLFEMLITADEAKLNKTSPELFLYAAKLMNTPPENCIVFDDVMPAVRSAKKAGMTTVAVRGDKRHNDGETNTVGADYVIENFNELRIKN